jgi:hypothetical protein
LIRVQTFIAKRKKKKHPNKKSWVLSFFAEVREAKRLARRNPITPNNSA